MLLTRKSINSQKPQWLQQEAKPRQQQQQEEMTQQHQQQQGEEEARPHRGLRQPLRQQQAVRKQQQCPLPWRRTLP
jgi:hypothetical protein